MNYTYILEGHTPVAADIESWKEWYKQSSSRMVAVDTVGQARISTFFIGLDYSLGEGPPRLFETMIFGGKHSNFQEHCATWEQAEAMHARAVALVLSDRELLQ